MVSSGDKLFVKEENHVSESQSLNKTTVALPVQGMTCASCVSHVQGALEGVEGVSRVVVNLATELATVHYDSDLVQVENLAQAVESAGYEVESETFSLAVGGMTCASCVAHVERSLSGLPGVLNAAVNLATEKATVSYVPSLVGIPDLVRAVVDAGYEVVHDLQWSHAERLRGVLHASAHLGPDPLLGAGFHCGGRDSRDHPCVAASLQCYGGGVRC